MKLLKLLKFLKLLDFRSKSELPQHTGWTFFDLGAELQRQVIAQSAS